MEAMRKLLSKERRWPRALMASVAGAIALSGCARNSGPSKAEAQKQIAAAHLAGFPATPHKGSKNGQFDLQFGTCELPGHIFMHPDGSAEVSVDDLPIFKLKNPGFEELGIEDRLHGVTANVTAKRLWELTDEGLTGLEPCHLTKDRATSVLDSPN